MGTESRARTEPDPWTGRAARPPWPAPSAVCEEGLCGAGWGPGTEPARGAAWPSLCPVPLCEGANSFLPKPRHLALPLPPGPVCHGAPADTRGTCLASHRLSTAGCRDPGPALLVSWASHSATRHLPLRKPPLQSGRVAPSRGPWTAGFEWLRLSVSQGPGGALSAASAPVTLGGTSGPSRLHTEPCGHCSPGQQGCLASGKGLLALPAPGGPQDVTVEIVSSALVQESRVSAAARAACASRFSQRTQSPGVRFVVFNLSTVKSLPSSSGSRGHRGVPWGICNKSTCARRTVRLGPAGCSLRTRLVSARGGAPSRSCSAQALAALQDPGL